MGVDRVPTKPKPRPRPKVPPQTAPRPRRTQSYLYPVDRGTGTVAYNQASKFRNMPESDRPQTRTVPSANLNMRRMGEALSPTRTDPGYEVAQLMLANSNFGAPSTAPAFTGGGGGGGRGGGGGGGGPTVNNQGMMDFLTRLLGSSMYTAKPMTDLRNTITGATAQDQAAATAAYNSLDAYLNANQTNPYLNVQLQRAQQAPDMSTYLGTQGVQPLLRGATNPEDTAYSSAQNVLALLGAGQTASNQSRLAESQMARTFAGQQIGAMDNAMLAQVAQQEATRQQALDQERRQAILQLAELVGAGATPDFAALGF